MPKYFAVSPTIWGLRLHRLGPHVATVYFYVQTCPVRLSEGYFRFPLAYAAADLELEPDVILDAIRKLETKRVIDFDEPNEVVLIRHALLYQPPTSENQIKGAISKLRNEPPSHLFSTFWHLARDYAPKLSEAIENDALLREWVFQFPEDTMPDPMGDPIGDTMPDSPRRKSFPNSPIGSYEKGVQEPRVESLEARVRSVASAFDARVVMGDL